MRSSASSHLALTWCGLCSADRCTLAAPAITSSISLFWIPSPRCNLSPRLLCVQRRGSPLFKWNRRLVEKLPWMHMDTKKLNVNPMLSVLSDRSAIFEGEPLARMCCLPGRNGSAGVLAAAWLASSSASPCTPLQASTQAMQSRTCLLTHTRTLPAEMNVAYAMHEGVADHMVPCLFWLRSKGKLDLQWLSKKFSTDRCSAHRAVATAAAAALAAADCRVWCRCTPWCPCFNNFITPSLHACSCRRLSAITMQREYPAPFPPMPPPPKPSPPPPTRPPPPKKAAGGGATAQAKR